MKAPDKVFFPNDINPLTKLSLVIKQKGDVCYIRKDTLLEWAKGEIMPGNSAEGKGWNWALQTLIDKIESL